jgi:hypothetical protein
LTHWLADRGVEVPGTVFDDEYARQLYATSRQTAYIPKDQFGTDLVTTLSLLSSRGLIESFPSCNARTNSST